MSRPDQYRERQPLEIEGLLTDDQRRTCSVDEHAHFIRSISTDERGVDSIDLDLDDMIVMDPYAGDPPSRRSDKELGRLLDLLDSLGERGSG